MSSDIAITHDNLYDMPKQMYCVQCQETSKNIGCMRFGCCGKNPKLSNMMDYLINILKGIGYYSIFAHKMSLSRTVLHEQAAEFIMKSLFMTITNANFDETAFIEQIRHALKLRNELAKDAMAYSSRTDTAFVGNFPNTSIMLTTHLTDILKDETIAHLKALFTSNNENKVVEKIEDLDNFLLYTDNETLKLTGDDIDYDKMHEIAFKTNFVKTMKDPSKRGLTELILFGLKGMSAYLVHALVLGFRNPEVENFLVKCLVQTEELNNFSCEDILEIVLETGKYGTEAMFLLDKANTSVYGNPEITEIDEYCVCSDKNPTVDDSVQGMDKLTKEQIKLFTEHPTILISGHDLGDLDKLLQQIQEEEEKNKICIKVFTHSEMLPTNAYPEIKKRYSKYLAGNFGLSWWRQVTEFNHFPGCFLFTTNCIIPFKQDSIYGRRVYTTGEVGCPFAYHIDNKKDFSGIISQAKSVFNQYSLEEKMEMIKPLRTKKVVIGFAHNQVEKLTDKIVDAIKIGKIKGFYVMSGCDGRHSTRDYYSKFASHIPKDHIVLTSGCAKYRYNMLNMGEIEGTGIPRVLDAGQCNDSISLVLIAKTLATALGTDISKLPLYFNIAWYEQKAIIVFLALLYNNIKNIRLGPTLPGFANDIIVKTLVEKFGVKVITQDDVTKDLEEIL